MITEFSNTDARISITLDFKTGKGNKTQLGIFKHGRLFWVMGERLSVHHATMNRWYVSVLVSEQTCSEEDYREASTIVGEKVKGICQALVKGFASKDFSVPNDTVGGKRWKRCCLDTWDEYRSRLLCQLKLTLKSVNICPFIPACLSLEVWELDCKSIWLQVKNFDYPSCQGHLDLSVFLYIFWWMKLFLKGHCQSPWDILKK